MNDKRPIPYNALWNLASRSQGLKDAILVYLGRSSWDNSNLTYSKLMGFTDNYVTSFDDVEYEIKMLLKSIPIKYLHILYEEMEKENGTKENEESTNEDKEV